MDKNQCDIGCSSLPWDIGYGKMPFLKDFEGMFKNDYSCHTLEYTPWLVLDCNTWSWVEPHKTLTVLYDLTCEVLQSYVIQSKPIMCDPPI